MVSRITLLLIAYRQLLKKRKGKRRFWVRTVLTERQSEGEYHVLIKELKLVDHEFFFASFRMLPHTFEELLRLVGPRLLKNCRNREAISPGERLAVTLRHLATGDSHLTIGLSYRISATTIGRIIYETCSGIWKVLLELGYLKVPSCAAEWREIAEGFESKWNFPNCVGAIDGKHVVIQAPPRSGSTYYNYKGTYSVVLLAVVIAFTLLSP